MKFPSGQVDPVYPEDVFRRGKVICTYCEREAFTPEEIEPPMCKRHYEVALLLSRARRQGMPATVESLYQLWRRSRAGTMKVQLEEMPELLQNLLVAEMGAEDEVVRACRALGWTILGVDTYGRETGYLIRDESYIVEPYSKRAILLEARGRGLGPIITS